MNIRKIIREEIDKIFLFEEKGVPDDVIKASYEVVKRISSYEKTILSDEWEDIMSREGNQIKAKTFNDTAVFRFDDLFFENIFVSMEFINLTDKNTTERVKTNSTRAKLMRTGIVFNSDKSKIKNFRLEIRICYIDKIEQPYVYGVIAHELTHLYEFYKKKKVYISRKHDIYNRISLECGDYPKLKDLTFLFYCMCYFELNANIVGLYHELFYNDKFTQEDLNRKYFQTAVYVEFLQNLEHPEMILTEDYVKSLTTDDLIALNNKIAKIMEDLDIKNFRAGAIKYRQGETVEAYIERTKSYCRKIYFEYYKNIDRVIKKIVKDKSNSFVKLECANLSTDMRVITENGKTTVYSNYFKNMWGWDFDS